MSLSYKKNKNANDLPARLRKATRPQPSQGCVPRGRSRIPSPSGASCEEVPSPEVALRATELYVRNSQGQSWQNSGHGAGGVRTSGSRSRGPGPTSRNRSSQSASPFVFLRGLPRTLGSKCHYHQFDGETQTRGCQRRHPGRPRSRPEPGLPTENPTARSLFYPKVSLSESKSQKERLGISFHIIFSFSAGEFLLGN